MPAPRSRKGLAAAAVVVVLIALGVAAALLLHAPGNVSHPNISFTQSTAQAPPSTPTTPTTAKAPPPPFLWARYGYDAGRTRNAPVAGRLHPPLRVGWRYQDYALLEFPPVMYGNDLYLVDDAGTSKAIDKRTGRVRWEHHYGSLAAASPAVGVRQGLIYVPLLSVNPNAGQSPGNGRMLALSMQNGGVRWGRTIAAGTESSPLAYDGRIYFGDAAGTVYCLNAWNGHTIWSYHAAGAVKGGPSYDNGNIFFGDYAGRAYSLRARDGHVNWAVSTSGTSFGFGSGNFYSTAAVAYGRVYLGNTDGRVYSFAEGSGQLAWATQTGAYVYASPAVANVPGMGPTVFLGSYDGNFYAFDARSGSVRWRHATGGRISGSPTVVGSTIYYSDLGDRTTIGLSTRTGAVQFHFPDGAFNPVIADPGAIYLSGYSMLYQMLPAGAPAARNPAPPSPRKPAVRRGRPAGKRSH